MFETIKNYYLKKIAKKQLEEFYDKYGLDSKKIENMTYTDLCLALKNVTDKMETTIDVLTEQNVMKTEYVHSLENAYQKVLKENENLKQESNKNHKIVYKLDREQEELAMENLSLKMKNEQLMAAISKTFAVTKPEESLYNVLNTKSVNMETIENKAYKIISASELPKGTEIAPVQGSSINLSME